MKVAAPPIAPINIHDISFTYFVDLRNLGRLPAGMLVRKKSGRPAKPSGRP
jgi:hypothetical protein